MSSVCLYGTNISTLLSVLHDHSVARSGLIVSGRAISCCWSYITRLLNTAIKGCMAVIDDSSCNDALLGFSRSGKRSVPPCFCARAGAVIAASRIISNGPRSVCMSFISGFLGYGCVLQDAYANAASISMKGLCNYLILLNILK